MRSDAFDPALPQRKNADSHAFKVYLRANLLGSVVDLHEMNAIQ